MLGAVVVICEHMRELIVLRIFKMTINSLLFFFFDNLFLLLCSEIGSNVPITLLAN